MTFLSHHQPGLHHRDWSPRRQQAADITINMLHHGQAKLPMPTPYDGTSNFMEWARELRTFLLISNFEYIPQLDDALTHDTEVTIEDILAHTPEGALELTTISTNNEAIAALQAEKSGTPEDQRPADRDDDTINGEIDVLETANTTAQTTLAGHRFNIEKAASYLLYILLHSTKPGSEINSHIRRLGRSTHGFEAWRLLRLRFSGGHQLQSYSLLQNILSPKWTESSQQDRFREWLENISRYEAEAADIADNLKVATLINALHGQVKTTSSPQHPTIAHLAASSRHRRELLQ